jgi:hypothetical protein
VHVPKPRVLGAGLPLSNRDRNLKWKQRRELRQPVELLPARLRRPLPTWEPQRELIAEAEDRVDGPGGLDPPQRQVGLLRELVDKQPTHKRVVDFDLVEMHPRDR